MAATQADWLQAYLLQTTDRLELSQFLTTYFTMNLSPEPALVAVDRIDGTDGQIRLGLLMLARPWYVAVIACVGLLLVFVWRGGIARASFWGGGAGVVLAVALLPPLLGLERAQARVEAGDRQLARGDGTAALSEYRAALVANHGLRASRPFWQRVAMAAAHAGGGRDAHLELVVPFAVALQRPAPENAELYGGAVRLLDMLRLPDSGGDPLHGGLKRAITELRSDLLLRQALVLRSAGDFNAATTALLRAELASDRAARFYQADIAMRQGGWLQAASLLRDLDARIAHPTVRADIACTLGDALTGAGLLLEARKAYLRCKEMDELTNYRLSKALGGT